ncbi:ion transporter [Synechococcales cyanobacterium C]|uniref:Ion transporter n=1 Tax=Petrachloros mirabilis ULC683 TaxID=2781853 RepID=A0A8K1ZY68_9CYAN|nr:ion transporter [Petrachloros mirabilis]NCJ07334.1 ion transporter [Petrachloros mirabilis ULC683]
MTIRQTLAFYLDDIESPVGLAVDVAVTLLVLASTAIFVIETYPISESVRWVLDLGNVGILWLFTLEYGLRLWCAEHRLQHVFRIYSLIDLLAILPFFVGWMDISFIRIFRWFRILRLVRFLEVESFLGKASSTDTVAFARILFTLFAIVFVYSGLIYQVENPINPGQFQTFLDAFYFSVVTMTTVGFGDVTPISEGGRLLTVLMILTGVALIPWQVGNLVRQLVQPQTQVTFACPQCGWSAHDSDARFCKRCGQALDT